MGYSRSVRRQLIALDLVEGIIDSTRAANPHNTKVDQILRKIGWRQQWIKSSLVWLNKKGGVVFESAREYRRYEQELTAVRGALLDQWPGEELDGREYLNAVLIYLDRMASVPSKNQSRWEEMIEGLQALYEEMDPGLEAESRMDAGERAAQALKEAIERV